MSYVYAAANMSYSVLYRYDDTPSSHKNNTEAITNTHTTAAVNHIISFLDGYLTVLSVSRLS